MTFSLAIFLGLIQGLTEFLPVSSSGHLVMLQKIFGVGEPPIFFTTIMHLGTLSAVLLFFGPSFAKASEGKVLRKIVIGTMPVVVVGLLVQPFVKEIFDSLPIVSAGYFLTALLLLWSKRLVLGQGKLKDLTTLQTLTIGGFQALAIFPGISRSGATIIEGLGQKLSREEAFKFSFYLSVPAVIGANILQLKDLSSVNFLPQSLVGMVAAFVVGCVSLNILQKVLLAKKLYYFSFYCFLLGIISLFCFKKF